MADETTRDDMPEAKTSTSHSTERGPNGGPVGHDGQGNKVEWVPDDENPEEVSPMILRRSDAAIHEAYKEMWDKVWWARHKDALRHSFGARRKEILRLGGPGAERRERQYGLAELQCDDPEYFRREGRLSALAWVLGSEWEESMDT